MITNPNRFIRGLSDLSDIVDDGLDDCVNVVLNAPVTPVVVNTTTSPVSSGASTLEEIEIDITKDGAQTITISDTPTAGYSLCINGLRQSKSAYSLSGNTLILPVGLQLFTGDVVSLLYLK